MPRLGQRVELLVVHKLVTQLPVERLDVRVLPGRPRRNQQRRRSHPIQPRPHRVRCELAAVVAANERRGSTNHEQLTQHFHDIERTRPSLELQRQALPRELIHHRKDLDPPTIRRPVVHEVVRPHVIRMLRPPTNDPVRRAPHPTTRAPTLRNSKILTPPQTMEPLVVHPPALLSQKNRDAAIAKPRIPPRVMPHLRHPASPTPRISDTRRPSASSSDPW